MRTIVWCLILAQLFSYALIRRFTKDFTLKSVSMTSIALVGAGPGDPKLLTVQAFELLKNADLVVADRLISPEILKIVTCELKVANKHPGCADKAQEEIYEWIAEAVKLQKNIVRLKIGDPFLFGRGGEEFLHFRAVHQLDPIVVPGVSSSYSAPLAAQIPLTHRGVSSQVLISTGYGRDCSTIELPEYSSDRTVVLLMAVGRLDDISQKMMSTLGYPPHLPVAIVERATTPLQRTIWGVLCTIGKDAEREGVRPPATVVIGGVVNILKTPPS
jgi:uroporphyrin-III C-methyltransferase